MKPAPSEPLCTGGESWQRLTRRECLNRFALGLGGVALARLLTPDARAEGLKVPGVLGRTHHAPKAKRIIHLFQSGGPSQLDLFDPKPLLNQRHGEQLPDSVRGSQRLTGMSANQSSIPIAGSPFAFTRHGESGHAFSELLPHLAKVSDDLCVIRSMHTESINHGPGVTFMQTGSQIPGRPSFGSWLDYGLGAENENLPSFVVLLTKDKKGQPLMSHLWGSGFLPSRHQGVRFRSGGDPVLYLGNPAGVSAENRRLALDRLRELHEHQFAGTPDAEISTRIANLEMAFRLQTSVPEVTDLKGEPDHVVDAYGPDARTPGSYAYNCLLARRLAERGVRFIQLYHQDWDHHAGLPAGLRRETQQTDRASAALVADLKSRGMLDDTLVVWGGEFGRTNYCQGQMTAGNFGRDHHPRCFSVWMAGGGVKRGIVHGETDEYGYNVVRDPVHIHDLHATILHLFGIDHEQLTYRFQGRRYRLTDVHGHVVKAILA
ncbi:MAG: hypothetical protein RLZZ188_2079 [Verrucomicrobiota bacterium]|jgi:hypothetical protein